MVAQRRVAEQDPSTSLRMTENYSRFYLRLLRYFRTNVSNAFDFR